MKKALILVVIGLGSGVAWLGYDKLSNSDTTSETRTENIQLNAPREEAKSVESPPSATKEADKTPAATNSVEYKAEAGKLIRPAVMAPLEVENWDTFNANLKQAKDIGVKAVSTDVWWGLVEKEKDQQFDWNYYDRVSRAITDAGLKWIPIFSFHQCGGGVGDTCDIPIPNWLWSKLGEQNPDKLKYKSEKGNSNSEVISLWADDKAESQYREFVDAFATHYDGISENIEELNISAGPSGELRYPSYNTHDGFKYPDRGFLQSYSDAAIEDFRSYVKDKYANIEGINSAWGTDLKSLQEVRPPSDAPGFFSRKDYLNIAYGKDFTTWYNQALIHHGELMIKLTTDTLQDRFANIPIGIKIPGIHWQINSQTIPRSAEISAGLINTSTDISSDTTAHGYEPILAMVRKMSTEARPIVLHFTCLEMDNTPSPEAYSMAKDLVFWVGNGAKKMGITIMGENALADGVMNDQGWNNIQNAIEWSDYRGLTTLRLGNLAQNDGLGFRRYKQLIDAYGIH